MLKHLLGLFALTFGFVQAGHSAEPSAKAGPDWWCLQKLSRPNVPNVKDAQAVRNPIDAFVLAKLEAKGLQLSSPAEKATLIRRVTVDLTGLPPTPEEIERFLKDASADAYAKVVDRLLASQAYGEHWARHWLDVARFAESQGFEYDRIRDNSWRYRDYVIKTLNDDKPYAQFVKEQLAGDVLKPVTTDGVIGTGFLVAGPFDQAGNGAASALIRAKAREDELEDMLSVVGQTFLGLTVNCARCHDHKFDPIPLRDYYRLKAVFDGVYHGDRAIASEDQRKVEERSAQLQKQIDVLHLEQMTLELAGKAKILARQKKDPAVRDGPRPLARWNFDRDVRDSAGTMHGHLKGRATIARGRLILDGKQAYLETDPLPSDLREKTLEAWVALDNLDQRGGGVLTVETTDGSVFDAIVYGERQHKKWIAGSNFFLRTRDITGAVEESAKAGELVHVAIVYRRDSSIAVYRNGDPYGEPVVAEGDAAKAVAFRANQTHVLMGLRHTGGGNAFLKGEIEEARLYDRALSADEVRASFQAGVDSISLREILAVLTEEQRQRHVQIDKEITRLKGEIPPPAGKIQAYAANSRQPGKTFVLKRGNVETKGDEVSAGPLSAVKDLKNDWGLSAETPEGQRRLKFAEWVVDRDNPLTWRVMANRIWQHHFGDGIVRTPNDFGFNGERPTHPELLDWLAVEFRDNGGSLKKLHRLILLSATYRQASKHEPKAAEIDADNRLLWRYPARRLPAESVRDAMLAVSGKLNRQAGGPGFRPFTISSFNSAFYLIFDDDKPELNRRSIYRIQVNSAKDPLLDVLDCPDPLVKTPKRNTTTTPLQALAMMNHSFVQRQAAAFADRVVKEAGPDENAQVSVAYLLGFGRTPTTKEIERAKVVTKEHGLKAVCWAILNASEFVYLR
jgi:hypothetical protein